MNTVATQLDGLPIPALRSLTIPAPLQPADTVYKSYAYRSRVWMTAVCLSIGTILAAWNRPMPNLPGYWELGLTLLGVVVFCLGAAIRVWASAYICARKSVDVVRTGPYSLCRNPLYWGTFLMVLAFPLLIRSPILALSMMPIVLLYLFGVVPVEESVMASRHGVTYASYCQSVPRWWPNFRGYVKGEPLGRQSEGFYKECGRLVWWVGLAIVFHVLFRFSNASWWLHPLNWW